MLFGVINLLFGTIKIYIYKIINFKRISFKLIPKINFYTNFNINRNCKISIGKKIRTRNNVSFYCLGKSKIEIGDNCFFNDNCMISCRENIIIGNNCIFGNNVSIYDNDHDYKNSLEKYVTNKVEIGDNTWCGCNVVILKGVTIGKNCVIAAGTLVNKDVPDNSIVYNSKELIIKKK
jgi:acetyltransferase-like isoleucine patch superfamily enzyme